jgi:hypothetical protein
MKKTPYTRAEILILVLVTLGFSVLCTAAMSVYLNRDNRWNRIVSPLDEKAVEIVAVTRLLQPYVRTQEGNLYFCTGGAWRDSCEKVTARGIPVSKVPARWLTCAPDLPELPPLPGSIVHSLAVAHCQEGKTYAKLVILDDGSIWRWQRSYSWVNNFALGTITIYSLILGAIGGIVLVHLRRYLRTPVMEPETHAKMM